MKIELKNFKIKDIVKNFKDMQELGVYGLDGNLNIRPPYQREFIYNNDEQNKVIESIFNNFPLNTMYWFKTNDGKYEILDGQQRTLSICCYHHNDFIFIPKDNEINKKHKFGSLQPDLQEKFLNYELSIYICDGTDSEKLDWFETINIAGKTLTKQELRNAIYSSKWSMEAKKYFSKTNGPGHNLSRDYINATINRQELLEKVLSWIANRDNITIDEYMISKKTENIDNANELRDYFEKIIDWIKTNFIQKRNEMKSIEWGILYNEHKDKKLDPIKIEEEINKLMLLPTNEIGRKAGIYEYVLDHDPKHLNLRLFNENQKSCAYERQKGHCAGCGEYFKIEEMHADHIIPWSKGGETIESNLQMLCRKCNLKKSNK